MSDEPQDPKFLETPGEPNPEADDRSASGQPPSEESKAQPGDAQGRDSDSFLRRLTGSLRRLTGPLFDTGSLGDTGSLEEPALKPDEGLSQTASTQELPEATGPAEDGESEMDLPAPDQESMEGLPSQRRMTGPLSESQRFMDTGSLAEVPSQPESAPEAHEDAASQPVQPAAGDEPERPSLEGSHDSRRMTGPLGDTGMLGDTGSLQEPPQPPPAEKGWKLDISEEEASEPLREEPASPTAEEGLDEAAAQRRMTGSLGDTGMLGDTGALSEPPEPPTGKGWSLDLPEEEAQEAAAPEPTEPPAAEEEGIDEIDAQRRMTGSLGDTGMLGDTGALPEPPQPPTGAGWALDLPEEEAQEEAAPEPVEPPAAEEDEIDIQRRMTGSLGDTGMLGDTGALTEPPQPPSEAGWMLDLRQEMPEPTPEEGGEEFDLGGEAEELDANPPEATASLRRMTGPLRESSELPESGILYEPGQQQVAPDWMSEIREETGEEAGLPEAVPPVEPPIEQPEEPIAPPAPQSTLRRVTGTLRRIITGALGRRSEAEEPEISDDMMAGRLEQTLTAAEKRDTHPIRPEKSSEDEERTTGSLIRRVTGSLRRVTGSLRGSGTGPLNEPPAQPQVRPAPWQATEPTPEEGGEAEEPGANPPEATASLRRMTGPLRESSELPESGILYEPGQQQVAPDWMSEIREETGEEAGLPEAVPPVEPPIEQPEEPVAPPAPQSPLRRMTGTLRRIITGALGRRSETEEPEISDDMVAGRLEPTLTAAQKHETHPIKPDREPEKGERTTTGSLIRRVTGSLRRVTGSLRGSGTGPLNEPPAPPPPRPVQWQMPAPTETPPAAPAPEEDRETPSDLGLEAEDLHSMEDQGGWDIEPPVVEPEEGEPLTGDEPISLLESGAIAALDEAEKRTVEPDWMSSIREETAQQDRESTPGERTEDETGFHRMTGSLRKMIGDMMGEPEQTSAREFEPDIPDELVSDRVAQGFETPVEFGEEPASET